MKQGATIAYGLRVRGSPPSVADGNRELESASSNLSMSRRKDRTSFGATTHRFSDVDGGTSIGDMVAYALPFGPLGRVVHRLQVARDLARIFDYRARRVQAVFS